MRILPIFTGFNDPYALGLLGEEQQPGPVLTLLRTQSFDRVVLLSILNVAGLGVELFGEKGLKDVIEDLNASVFARRTA